MCMPCVNTELKVSVVNRMITPCEIAKLDDKVEMDLISFEIEKSQQQIEYLEWQKVKVAKVSKKVLPTTEPEVNPIKRNFANFVGD